MERCLLLLCLVLSILPASSLKCYSCVGAPKKCRLTMVTCPGSDDRCGTATMSVNTFPCQIQRVFKGCVNSTVSSKNTLISPSEAVTLSLREDTCTKDLCNKKTVPAPKEIPNDLYCHTCISPGKECDSANTSTMRCKGKQKQCLDARIMGTFGELADVSFKGCGDVGITSKNMMFSTNTSSLSVASCNENFCNSIAGPPAINKTLNGIQCYTCNTIEGETCSPKTAEKLHCYGALTTCLEVAGVVVTDGKLQPAVMKGCATPAMCNTSFLQLLQKIGSAKVQCCNGDLCNSRFTEDNLRASGYFPIGSASSKTGIQSFPSNQAIFYGAANDVKSPQHDSVKRGHTCNKFNYGSSGTPVSSSTYNSNHNMADGLGVLTIPPVSPLATNGQASNFNDGPWNSNINGGGSSPTSTSSDGLSSTASALVDNPTLSTDSTQEAAIDNFYVQNQNSGYDSTVYSEGGLSTDNDMLLSVTESYEAFSSFYDSAGDDSSFIAASQEPMTTDDSRDVDSNSNKANSSLIFSNGLGSAASDSTSNPALTTESPQDVNSLLLTDHNSNYTGIVYEEDNRIVGNDTENNADSISNSNGTYPASVSLGGLSSGTSSSIISPTLSSDSTQDNINNMFSENQNSFYDSGYYVPGEDTTDNDMSYTNAEDADSNSKYPSSTFLHSNSPSDSINSQTLSTESPHDVNNLLVLMDHNSNYTGIVYASENSNDSRVSYAADGNNTDNGPSTNTENYTDSNSDGEDSYPSSTFLDSNVPSDSINSQSLSTKSPQVVNNLLSMDHNSNYTGIVYADDNRIVGNDTENNADSISNSNGTYPGSASLGGLNSGTSSSIISPTLSSDSTQDNITNMFSETQNSFYDSGYYVPGEDTTDNDMSYTNAEDTDSNSNYPSSTFLHSNAPSDLINSQTLSTKIPQNNMDNLLQMDHYSSYTGIVYADDNRIVGNDTENNADSISNSNGTYPGSASLGGLSSGTSSSIISPTLSSDSTQDNINNMFSDNQNSFYDSGYYVPGEDTTDNVMSYTNAEDTDSNSNYPSSTYLDSNAPSDSINSQTLSTKSPQTNMENLLLMDHNSSYTGIVYEEDNRIINNDTGNNVDSISNSNSTYPASGSLGGLSSGTSSSIISPTLSSDSTQDNINNMFSENQNSFSDSGYYVPGEDTTDNVMSYSNAEDTDYISNYPSSTFLDSNALSDSINSQTLSTESPQHVNNQLLTDHNSNYTGIVYADDNRIVGNDTENNADSISNSNGTYPGSASLGGLNSGTSSSIISPTLSSDSTQDNINNLFSENQNSFYDSGYYVPGEDTTDNDMSYTNAEDTESNSNYPSSTYLHSNAPSGWLNSQTLSTKIPQNNMDNLLQMDHYSSYTGIVYADDNRIVGNDTENNADSISNSNGTYPGSASLGGLSSGTSSSIISPTLSSDSTQDNINNMFSDNQNSIYDSGYYVPGEDTTDNDMSYTSAEDTDYISNYPSSTFLHSDAPSDSINSQTLSTESPENNMANLLFQQDDNSFYDSGYDTSSYAPAEDTTGYNSFGDTNESSTIYNIDVYSEEDNMVDQSTGNSLNGPIPGQNNGTVTSSSMERGQAGINHEELRGPSSLSGSAVSKTNCTPNENDLISNPGVDSHASNTNSALLAHNNGSSDSLTGNNAMTNCSAISARGESDISAGISQEAQSSNHVVQNSGNDVYNTSFALPGDMNDSNPSTGPHGGEDRGNSSTIISGPSTSGVYDNSYGSQYMPSDNGMHSGVNNSTSNYSNSSTTSDSTSHGNVMTNSSHNTVNTVATGGNSYGSSHSNNSNPGINSGLNPVSTDHSYNNVTNHSSLGSSPSGHGNVMTNSSHNTVNTVASGGNSYGSSHSNNSNPGTNSGLNPVSTDHSYNNVTHHGNAGSIPSGYGNVMTNSSRDTVNTFATGGNNYGSSHSNNSNPGINSALNPVSTDHSYNNFTNHGSAGSSPSDHGNVMTNSSHNTVNTVATGGNNYGSSNRNNSNPGINSGLNPVSTDHSYNNVTNHSSLGSSPSGYGNVMTNSSHNTVNTVASGGNNYGSSHSNNSNPGTNSGLNPVSTDHSYNNVTNHGNAGSIPSGYGNVMTNSSHNTVNAVASGGNSYGSSNSNNSSPGTNSGLNPVSADHSYNNVTYHGSAGSSPSDHGNVMTNSSHNTVNAVATGGNSYGSSHSNNSNPGINSGLNPVSTDHSYNNVTNHGSGGSSPSGHGNVMTNSSHNTVNTGAAGGNSYGSSNSNYSNPGINSGLNPVSTDHSYNNVTNHGSGGSSPSGHGNVMTNSSHNTVNTGAAGGNSYGSSNSNYSNPGINSGLNPVSTDHSYNNVTNHGSAGSSPSDHNPNMTLTGGNVSYDHNGNINEYNNPQGVSGVNSNESAHGGSHNVNLAPPPFDGLFNNSNGNNSSGNSSTWIITNNRNPNMASPGGNEGSPSYVNANNPGTSSGGGFIYNSHQMPSDGYDYGYNYGDDNNFGTYGEGDDSNDNLFMPPVKGSNEQAYSNPNDQGLSYGNSYGYDTNAMSGHIGNLTSNINGSNTNLLPSEMYETNEGNYNNFIRMLSNVTGVSPTLLSQQLNESNVGNKSYLASVLQTIPGFSLSNLTPQQEADIFSSNSSIRPPSKRDDEHSSNIQWNASGSVNVSSLAPILARYTGLNQAVFLQSLTGVDLSNKEIVAHALSNIDGFDRDKLPADIRGTIFGSSSSMSHSSPSDYGHSSSTQWNASGSVNVSSLARTMAGYTGVGEAVISKSLTGVDLKNTESVAHALSNIDGFDPDKLPADMKTHFFGSSSGMSHSSPSDYGHGSSTQWNASGSLNVSSLARTMAGYTGVGEAVISKSLTGVDLKNTESVAHALSNIDGFDPDKLPADMKTHFFGSSSGMSHSSPSDYGHSSSNTGSGNVSSLAHRLSSFTGLNESFLTEKLKGMDLNDQSAVIGVLSKIPGFDANMFPPFIWPSIFGTNSNTNNAFPSHSGSNSHPLPPGENNLSYDSNINSNNALNTGNSYENPIVPGRSANDSETSTNNTSNSAAFLRGKMEAFTIFLTATLLLLS
ncbi:serine-rich adhesin for platelets-like [Hyperolius riggenbachi]|uniref:serine-rich adhesin for platelets-like n=1 Tax=Hyperolius riggenbachi TaxID=752182 RepID=UPI0035A2790E